jgi:hypothetical protein
MHVSPGAHKKPVTEQRNIQYESRSFDPTAWVLSSRKRLYLALYLDYLIVSAGWALLQYGLQPLRGVRIHRF